MSEENNQNQIDQEAPDTDNKNRRNWLIEIISALALIYLVFSLTSPILLPPEKQPRKIETSDIIVLTIILIFNSGLLNRLEDFGISREGGITAKFRELKQEVNKQKQEVNKQKKEIDELQAQQLQQLEQQQKNLEEMQAFMYSFLLGEKDCEKIEQLDKHSQAKTSYDFRVSEKVGDELRRLRDLKLIESNGYISDIVRASDHGKRSIDLTKYVRVTDLGKKFLMTRETLQSTNQQELTNSQETPEV